MERKISLPSKVTVNLISKETCSVFPKSLKVISFEATVIVDEMELGNPMLVPTATLPYFLTEFNSSSLNFRLLLCEVSKTFLNWTEEVIALRGFENDVISVPVSLTILPKV